MDADSVWGLRGEPSNLLNDPPLSRRKAAVQMKIKVYAGHDCTVLIYIIATINYPQINGVHMRIV